MKKIPTLFERIYENHKIISITDTVTPGMEWVLAGEGVATLKFDGSCCAIINSAFYKRYDCKNGKTPPKGAIACCDPDPITGHWPHFVPVNFQKAEDQWFVEAYNNTAFNAPSDGTYEAVGPHFQKNPYKLRQDILIRHSDWTVLNVARTFDGIREFLKNTEIEGIVFWKDNEPQCKIKRSDFGFEWPVKSN